MPAQSWDEEISRAVSAREDTVRVALRDGKSFTNEYRQRQWPFAAPAAPVAVYLARGGRYYALAFDVDAPRREADRQAAVIASTLMAAGIVFVEAESGPAGHRHLICTWRQGLDAEEVACVARRLQILAPALDVHPLTNPSTGCIRPPGATHRDGGASRLITPRRDALARLRAGNDVAAFARLRDALGVEPRSGRPSSVQGRASCAIPAALPRVGGEWKLPRARRELSGVELGWMRTAGADPEGDRSAVTARATLLVAHAGWTFAEYLTLVRDPSIDAFDHLRRRRANGNFVPRREIEAAARRMWRQRLRFAATHPTTGAVAVVPAVEECATAAAAARWAGQGGPRERAVLEALVATARQVGKDTVSCGIRSLAVETGGSRTAVAAALNRLRDDGWIELVTEAAGPLAASYRLAVPAGNDSNAVPSSTDWTLAPTPPARVPVDVPEQARTFALGFESRAHDTMCFEGLGRYAGFLMELLTREMLTLDQLSVRTGWDPRTVRRHLGRLAAHGLVIPGEGYEVGQVWEANPRRLDEAARSLRVAGVVTRRRDHHREERLVWAWWLADFAADRGWASRRGRRTPGYRTTKTGAPCPAQPFPSTSDGRRDWRAALSLVASGQGLGVDEYDALVSVARSARLNATPAAVPPNSGNAVSMCATHGEPLRLPVAS